MAQGWGLTGQGDQGQVFRADLERELMGVQANFLQSLEFDTAQYPVNQRIEVGEPVMS